MIAKISKRKSMGVHYTPPRLAQFVAERLIEHARPTPGSPIRILDPACGDGALLQALRNELAHVWYGHAEVCGVEADGGAAEQARQRLAGWKDAGVRILHADFLALCAEEGGQQQLWEPKEPNPLFYRAFDLVIANPPYVRTQVLGAQTARQLGERFGLKGRVDLYHAFWVAMTEALREGGVIGIVTSNRFLSTLAGASVRRFLARNYLISEIIDLGDTKLFEAAVLPAIFVGRRSASDAAPKPARGGNFIRLYSCPETGGNVEIQQYPKETVYSLLRHGKPGRYRVAEGCFELARGPLVVDPDPTKVWELTTPEEARWLDMVRAASTANFGSLARIRVGVKTTADDVFIRSDWETLPVRCRPEESLLRPLLSHEHARRWLCDTEFEGSRILYPHVVENGVRKAIDLDSYPHSKAYLESHRERLERRTYVRDAGRGWYEIWVPQDPSAWEGPKIVFPDISAEPRFYLDTTGRIVDGDSYWITLRPGVPTDVLFVLLAIANSRVMSRYHDLSFNNRLYSSRRRFITQYVSRYPVPDLQSRPCRELAGLVQAFLTRRDAAAGGNGRTLFEAKVNQLVGEAFGLGSEADA